MQMSNDKPTTTNSKVIHDSSQLNNDANCIFSMFASDGKKSSYFVPLRITPFCDNTDVVPIKFNKKYKHLATEVQFDNSTHNLHGIYYYNIGIGTNKKWHWRDALYFNTPQFKWPKLYSLILWIKWSSLVHMHITFDSAEYAPIIMSHKKILGVAASYENGGWKKLILNNCTENIKEDFSFLDGWLFVVGIGGCDSNSNTEHCTQFYIGDMDNVPKHIGSVPADISGLNTNRIGNGNEHRQGPGPIASILVFDKHLNIQQLNDIYFETKTEIGMNWTNNELCLIKQYFLKYLNVESVIDIIFTYIRFKTYTKSTTEIINNHNKQTTKRKLNDDIIYGSHENNNHDNQGPPSKMQRTNQ
eukprot:220667_1